MIKDQIETYKLIIEGMDCQDEVNIIEKKLKKKTFSFWYQPLFAAELALYEDS